MLKDKRGRELKGDYKVGYKKLDPEKRIKKGEVRNPLGINDPLKRAFRRMTREELIELGSMVMHGSIEELEAMGRDKSIPAAKAMIAALVVKVIKRGDTTAFETLLNRIVGPVKQKMELTGRDGAPLASPALSQVVLYLPKNGKTKEENDPGSGNPPPSSDGSPS